MITENCIYLLFIQGITGEGDGKEGRDSLSWLVGGKNQKYTRPGGACL